MTRCRATPFSATTSPLSFWRALAAALGTALVLASTPATAQVPSGMGSVRNFPDAALRGAGLSGNKLLAVRDLALKCREGTVPSLKVAAKLGDDELIARLTEVCDVDRIQGGELVTRDELGRLYLDGRLLDRPFVLGPTEHEAAHYKRGSAASARAKRKPRGV